MRRRYSLLLLIAVASTTGTVLAQKDIKPPETFTANAQALGRNAGASAEVTIQINRSTSESDRKAIEEALRIGGYQGFLPALRSAPEVGYVEMNGRKSLIRWARQQSTDKGRTISIVTESPIAFVGGAAVDARPRKGYEVAVIRLTSIQIRLGYGFDGRGGTCEAGGADGSPD